MRQGNMVAADVEGTYCNAEAALQKMEFQISVFGQMEFQISTLECSSTNTSALGPNAFRASREMKE